MAGMFSPFVTALGQPFTMLIPSILAALNFFASFCLGQPGDYLPAATTTLNDSVNWLKSENGSQAFDNSILN